jgi:hypothetical protein
MMGKAPTENSKGVRLVNLPQVRDIDERGVREDARRPADRARRLDNAVERGNKPHPAGDRELMPSWAARACGPRTISD